MKSDCKFEVSLLQKSELNKKILKDIIYELNEDYPIPLVEKINIESYISKIFDLGFVLLSKHRETIIGFVTFYANNFEVQEAAFSLLGVSKEYRKFGIATLLFEKSFEIMKKEGMNSVFSYTHKDNIEAIKFHQKIGFSIDLNRITNQPYNVSLIRNLQ